MASLDINGSRPISSPIALRAPPVNEFYPARSPSGSESSSTATPYRDPVEFDDEIKRHGSEREASVGKTLRMLGKSVQRRLGLKYPSTRRGEILDGLPERHSGTLISGEARRRYKACLRTSFKKALCALPFLVLCVFGIIHLLQAVLEGSRGFWNVDTSGFLPDWGMPGRPGSGLAEYPTDATRGVMPIPCHSHNDYLRRVPLFNAIHLGCISVEADVWMLDEELYVGHQKSALTRSRTFRSLYLDPLLDLLDQMNPVTAFANSTDHGVFDTDPNQTLILLVDMKTDGHKTFPYVYKQLEALRSKDYLTYWDGDKLHPRAVTVVGTGNTPLDMIVGDDKYRDIFFDAPLGKLQGEWEEAEVQGTAESEVVAVGLFDTSTSYYASVSFKRAVGTVQLGRLSHKQMDVIRNQIAGAKRRGLKVRYWETPSWPINLRNYVWSTLMEEGADVLNVDDLGSAALEDWKVRVHRFGI